MILGVPIIVLGKVRRKSPLRKKFTEKIMFLFIDTNSLFILSSKF